MLFVQFQSSKNLKAADRQPEKCDDSNAHLFPFFSLFSCHSINRRPKRTLYSKKYGVDLIRYTHAANTVVYSSNKIDGMLMHRYSFVVVVLITCSRRVFSFLLVGLLRHWSVVNVYRMPYACGSLLYYSLWSEVVVCTVWGSVILPHTGANCTSDCLAHGGVNSSDLPVINLPCVVDCF